MSETADKLAIRVVTPRGQIASIETDAIVAPGELGDFEIMVGHVPFLSALHPGVLQLGEKGPKAVFAVSRGYLQVDNVGNVEVLVEQAVESAQVDIADATQAREQADGELSAWEGELDGDWRTLKDRRDWAQAQIDASSLYAN